MDIKSLNRLLGNIDLYLLDLILKGRFDKSTKILDAGCGEGRNTHYFIQEGYSIYGIDKSPSAIKMARAYATTLSPAFDPLRFQVAPVEDLPFHNGAFDALLSSAVMHFATDTVHFHRMLDEQMRVLVQGGIFWLRMCTDADGLFKEMEHLENGRALLPDGSERFILTNALLEELMKKHHLHFVEPPKSVLVHGLRAMGVFLFKKEK
ncbi:class I SAM-dependent methyltransferase [Negadavirga shengliensis]|uniref:Class I SAM-dependent methyltransferase n=1 Tax=Negadavirga shengliensis TaxID=1389218 RepID=A0ABV9T0M0_9BACT